MIDSLHCADRLSEFLDGDLSPEDQTACTAHLETCPACRDTLRTVREVRDAVATLPGVAPSSDLWPGIAERLGEGTSPLRLFSASGPRRVIVSLRSLAAAAALVAVASGSLVWWAFRPVSPNAPSLSGDAPEPVLALAVLDASMDPIIADLEQLLRDRASSLDPAVLDSVKAELRSIDQSLATIRSALAEDPSSGSLNRQVARLLRAKVERLRDAALGTAGQGAA